MTRRLLLVAIFVCAAALPLSAEFFSKRYDFVQERWIKLDQAVGSVTVQDVQFEFPSYIGPKKLEIKGRNTAVVNVKNYGTAAMRIHVAVALFDADNNLVACGTTGSKLGSTKPGEEESFFVNFDYVKSRLSSAKYFYLTVETEPPF